MNQKNFFRILIAICLLGNTHTTNAQQMKDGFVKIFNGKSMAGWEADTTFWKVKDNSFVGEVTPQTPIKTNTFLIYRESLPADFELKAKYRISAEGNSGINYRSEELPTIKYALKGYQAMMKGKAIVISDFGFAILIKYLSPFIPDRFILKVVEKMQTK